MFFAKIFFGELEPHFSQKNRTYVRTYALFRTNIFSKNVSSNSFWAMRKFFMCLVFKHLESVCYVFLRKNKPYSIQKNTF